MKYKVLTLFPEMIESVMGTGIIGRALKQGAIELETVNIRDFADNNRAQVDDYPYGGGAGQVIMAQPVYAAYTSAVKDDSPDIRRRVIYLSPQGRRFDQRIAKEFAEDEELVFLCGHYEGVDERVLDEIVTDYISAGDYILTGGELPALIVMDAISRLLPGVLGNSESPDEETFYRDLLEYPQYSRPEVWHHKKVPKVLLSGNHKDIEDWRLKKSIERTSANRPDLFEKYQKKNALADRMKKARIQNIPASEALRFSDSEILLDGTSYYAVYDLDEKTFYAGCFEKKNVIIDGYESEVIRKLIYRYAYKAEKCYLLNMHGILPDIISENKTMIVFTEKNPLSTARVKEYGDFGEYLREAVIASLERGRTFYGFLPVSNWEHIKQALAIGLYSSGIRDVDLAIVRDRLEKE